MDRAHPIRILLVEDNPGDIRLVEEAFMDAGVPQHVYVVENGVEAMAFLRREGRYSRAPRPDMIFLDLNLPAKDGRETLAEIKEDPSLRVIPVLILTSSQAPEDIRRAYELYANSYVVKPNTFQELVKVMRSVVGFWFEAVRLPTEEAGSAKRGEI